MVHPSMEDSSSTTMGWRQGIPETDIIRFEGKSIQRHNTKHQLFGRVYEKHR